MIDNMDFDINGTCFAAFDYSPGEAMAFREYGSGRTVVAIATVPIKKGDVVIIDLVSKTVGLDKPHFKLIKGDRDQGGRV